MWNRHDWHEFFERTNRPWERLRPLRPVHRGDAGRVEPAAGFSLAELHEAGISLDAAEVLGLPVDAGRVNAYGPNVSALRDFLRAARHLG